MEAVNGWHPASHKTTVSSFISKTFMPAKDVHNIGIDRRVTFRRARRGPGHERLISRPINHSRFGSLYQTR